MSYEKYAHWQYVRKINMQICKIKCKICKQYAGFDDIALYCMQYAKYAKKICTICKICSHFQYAEYALPTSSLLMLRVGR